MEAAFNLVTLVYWSFGGPNSKFDQPLLRIISWYLPLGGLSSPRWKFFLSLAVVLPTGMFLAMNNLRLMMWTWLHPLQSHITCNIARLWPTQLCDMNAQTTRRLHTYTAHVFMCLMHTAHYLSFFSRVRLKGVEERSARYSNGAWQKLIFVVLADSTLLQWENIFDCDVSVPHTKYSVRKTTLYSPGNTHPYIPYRKKAFLSGLKCYHAKTNSEQLQDLKKKSPATLL